MAGTRCDATPSSLAQTGFWFPAAAVRSKFQTRQMENWIGLKICWTYPMTNASFDGSVQSWIKISRPTEFAPPIIRKPERPPTLSYLGFGRLVPRPLGHMVRIHRGATAQQDQPTYSHTFAHSQKGIRVLALAHFSFDRTHGSSPVIGPPCCDIHGVMAVNLFHRG